MFRNSIRGDIRDIPTDVIRDVIRNVTTSVISTVIGKISRNANREMNVVRQESLSPRRLIMVETLNTVHGPSGKVKCLGEMVSGKVSGALSGMNAEHYRKGCYKEPNLGNAALTCRAIIERRNELLYRSSDPNISIGCQVIVDSLAMPSKDPSRLPN